MAGTDRFIRFPTPFLEALLHARISGAQWRILGWVIRQTLGWNRDAIPFTWYLIANDLNLDRAGVFRAGRELLEAGFVYVRGNEIGVQTEPHHWNQSALERHKRPLTTVNDDKNQRKAMTGIIASVDSRHRKRGQKSSVFRRTKDSSKDTLKTYKDNRLHTDDVRHRFVAESTERQPLARGGAPIPGKYDRLSED